MTVFSHRWRRPAALSAAAALCAGSAWLWTERSRTTTITDTGPTVVTDGLSTRWFAGRLSGLSHKPFDPATPRLPSALLLAEARASAAARERPSADTLWALGLQQLVNGRADAAVVSLERAAENSPERAQLLTDLAAAYLAGSRGRPDNLVRALSASVRSRLLSPSAAATFNEALALDELRLWSRTVEAWTRLQSLERDPAWMADARERLPEAARGSQWTEASDEDPATEMAARDAVESTWLTTWAGACARGDAGSMARAATAVREASAVIVEATADRYWSALASHLTSVSQPGRCQSLADGVVRYREGRDLYDRDQLLEADRRFKESAVLLETAGSPMAGWARLYAAFELYHRGRMSDAVTSLASVVRRSEADGQLLLAARARLSLGVIHYVQGDYSAALSAYRRALAGFQQTRARPFEAEAYQGLAETYSELGEWGLAWHYFHAAIAQRPDRAWKREALLVSAGMTALQQNLPGAALAFQSEAVDLSTRSGRLAGTAEALLQRARIFQRLAQSAPALADLSHAMRDIVGIADPSLRVRLDADAAAVEGMLVRSGDPLAASAAMSRAIAFYRRSGFDTQLPALLLERARTSMAASRWNEAEQDLVASLDVLDLHRAGLHDEPLKIRYADASYDIVEELLRLQVRGRVSPAGALEVAERARARALTDAVGSPPSAGWLPRLQRDLSNRQVVLYYASLDEQLLIWRIDAASVRLEIRPIRRSGLAALIERHRQALLSNDERASDEAGSALTAIVLGPFETALAEGTTLVIVPDGALNHLAFAALPSTVRPGRLIERVTVVVSPNARFASRSESRAGRVPASVMAVGDPLIDRSIFPDAPQLPRSAREARDIATLYPSSTTLLGAAATRRAFLQGLGHTDVVHFAGHSRSNSESPLLSYLLLANDADGGSPAVFAGDVSHLRLTGVSLVVLASCESAMGATFRGEGAVSLARPFLAAGVSNVVASLWDVADDDTHDLFVRFHRRVRAGRSPPQALRDAQLALAGDGRPARAWAGFVVIGAR